MSGNPSNKRPIFDYGKGFVRIEARGHPEAGSSPYGLPVRSEGFRPLLPAQVRVIMKPGADPGAYGSLSECRCIGCGCTDTHGCLTAHGACHWMRVDTVKGIGVCSECEHMVEPYDKARRPSEQKRL